MRATRTCRWGVDINSDSDRSLTVAAIPPCDPDRRTAMVVCNASAAKPITAGDVIVAINAATTQAAMLEKLKQETSLTMDIVRRSKFDAVIERKSTLDDKGQTKQESLGLKVRLYGVKFGDHQQFEQFSKWISNSFSKYFDSF